MRRLLLLPAIIVVTTLAGCASEEGEQATASLPPRDLTLQAQGPALEIASPVELQQIRTRNQTVRTSRPTPAAVVVPAVSLPAPMRVDQPATTEFEEINDGELPPGKTVTLIPASAGPSPGTDEANVGSCRPRSPRPGIGIAARPRPRPH
jgi:hypothetical protein